MKQRFYLFQRNGTFYIQDSRSGKQQSLETKERKEALRLIKIKRQAVEHPGFQPTGPFCHPPSKLPF